MHTSQRGVKIGGALRAIQDMSCNCTLTVKLREGGTVTVYRTEGHN